MQESTPQESSFHKKVCHFFGATFIVMGRLLLAIPLADCVTLLLSVLCAFVGMMVVLQDRMVHPAWHPAGHE